MKWLSTAAVGILLSTGAVAHAAVIPATVACALGACTVTPNAAPIAVDPNGFTLDLDWAPQDIVLSGLEQNDWWALVLHFDFTGTHDGTDNFGVITLVDEFGVAVANLNEQFDDVHVAGNSFTANYQIFNDGADFDEFFVRGLQLAFSDGSGVDTLDFTKAVFSPASVRVPEPVSILLLGAGLAAVGRRRFRSGL